MSESKSTPIARLPRASKRAIRQCTFDDDTESEILSAIRKALGREPDLVLWRLSPGKGVSLDAVKRLLSLMLAGRIADAIRLAKALVCGRLISFGLSVNGCSDLIGILAGRFVALEVKTPAHLARIRRAVDRNAADKLSASDQAQLMFLGVVRLRGGFGAFVDSVESARAAIARARNGETS